MIARLAHNGRATFRFYDKLKMTHFRVETATADVKKTVHVILPAVFRARDALPLHFVTTAVNLE